MIHWWGLSMEATRAIALVANDATCSSRCRLAAGRAIHSRMIGEPCALASCSNSFINSEQGRFTNCEARSVRTGSLDERLLPAGLSSPRCFGPCLGLCSRDFVASHHRSDLMLYSHCRRKFYLSSEPVRAHGALPSSAFDCFLAPY